MRIAWTIAFGLVTGLAAQPAAQPAEQPPEGRGAGRGRFPVMNAGFSALDVNGDGTLDATEIVAAPQSLAKLDKNSDGRITSEEVRPSMPPGRGRGGESESAAAGSMIEDTVKTLMAFDVNGDGKLSRSELPERFQGIFERADGNKDGYLTPEEIRKVAAAQAAPPQSPGMDGNREGPGEGRGEGPRREMNFVWMDPVLAAVDTDGDGILSAGEIRNAANAIRKLDKNGDGKVTRDEATPAAGPGRRF